MSGPHGAASNAPPTTYNPAIQRLLFVSDAAVADVDELPPAVRTVIDAASEIYVLTPTLPGRLAWLADDVDRFRHYADERLDTVLSHMHAIGADAGGAAARGSVLTVIADAVTEFEPDHILIALHVSDHANWQERRLIEHVEERFRLPVTTFAVDPAGHTPHRRWPAAALLRRIRGRQACDRVRRPPARRSRCARRDRLATDACPRHLRVRRRDRQHVRLRRSSIAPPPNSAAASPTTASASRSRRACTPSRSPSRPPDRCGSRSSRSPTATTPPRSSWAPAD